MLNSNYNMWSLPWSWPTMMYIPGFEPMNVSESILCTIGMPTCKELKKICWKWQMMLQREEVWWQTFPKVIIFLSTLLSYVTLDRRVPVHSSSIQPSNMFCDSWILYLCGNSCTVTTHVHVQCTHGTGYQRFHGFTWKDRWLSWPEREHYPCHDLVNVGPSSRHHYATICIPMSIQYWQMQHLSGNFLQGYRTLSWAL